MEQKYPRKTGWFFNKQDLSTQSIEY